MQEVNDEPPDRRLPPRRRVGMSEDAKRETTEDAEGQMKRHLEDDDAEGQRKRTPGAEQDDDTKGERKHILGEDDTEGHYKRHLEDDDTEGMRKRTPGLAEDDGLAES
jgi:hypothetical protein